jgi:DhnA family fructose-bisphosphate aldolase class Ia
MSEIGKQARISQFFNKESNNSVMAAMDHAAVVGPIEGIVDPVKTVKLLCEERPDTFFMPNGVIKRVYPYFIESRIPYIIALDTCTQIGPEPDYFMLSDTVEHAITLGASAVSMHVFLGPQKTSDMLKGLAKTAEACDKYGMPLLAIMYPEGFENNCDVKLVKWAARIGAELGADIVKAYYTGSKETFAEVVEACPIPVLLSGGAKTKDPKEFLTVLKNTIDAGGHGCAVGRNVWQNKDPKAMLRATKMIVHEGSSVDEAMKVLLAGS